MLVVPCHAHETFRRKGRSRDRGCVDIKYMAFMKRKTKMSESEILERLSGDWLERDGDSFVRIRKTGRLGWEKELEEGTPYSSYLLGTPHMDELIRRAYPLAKQTISAMDVPFKVGVKISDSRSCTEAKNVYVATSYFDDPTLSAGEKLDIFIGLTAHEGSHLLYTQFDQMGKARAVHPLCGNLLNIIEDERIERMLGEEKPGLANYIKAVKEHYFGKYCKGTEDSKESVSSPMARIVNAILGLVRYPRILSRDELVEFGELLIAVKDILTPYPSSTVESEQAAEKIFAMIREEYNDESGSSDGGYKESESGKKDSKGRGKRGESSDGERGDEKCAPAEKSSDSSPKTGENTSRDFDKDYRSLSGSLSEVAGGPVQPDMEGCTSLRAEDMSDEMAKDGGLLSELCEGSAETGSDKDTVFRRAEDNQSRYLRALSEVRQYVPAVSRVVKGRCRDWSLTHYGMRSGLLDTGKLAEAVQGVPSVYVRKGEVRSDRANVCILVDESGSMIREERMTAARRTAVLLNEALSGMSKVDLYIYGHSADETVAGRTDLRIYREKGFTPRYALGSLEARDNNRDGTAILETARRVRKQTDEEVLMFIISDGAPAAQGYIGREAIAHTKACVEQAERMGFRIVQICINASYDPAMMFRRYIKLENMSTLASDLGKMIAKTLAENIKTHSTI